MPTSWMPRLSRAVSGRAVAGWFDLDVFLERSSLLGRGRELGMLGDAGSFLTMIFGLGVRPPARDLLAERQVSNQFESGMGQSRLTRWEGMTWR